MAAHGGSELEQGEIYVAGVRRSYWLARAPRWLGQPAPPLLIALHGSGMDGKGLARFTGLAERGPAAGITVAFPDGWQQGCHPDRPIPGRAIRRARRAARPAPGDRSVPGGRDGARVQSPPLPDPPAS